MTLFEVIMCILMFVLVICLINIGAAINDNAKELIGVVNAQLGNIDVSTMEIRDAIRELELVGDIRDDLVEDDAECIELKTGRSHQIRSQFAHIGHPLYGDTKYGTGGDNGQLALFCNQMAIIHPVKGERMSFTAAMPSSYPWALFKE